LDGDRPERRLYAIAPRQAEDRRREDLTDVFRLTWEHGVNGQAQVIKGMQQIIHSYTLLQALSETGANVRWLIAAGIRDFQAMLEELHKLQSDLPRDAPAPDEPTPRRLGCMVGPPSRVGSSGGDPRTPAVRFVAGGMGRGRGSEAG
jgi:hypothetical protein